MAYDGNLLGPDGKPLPPKDGASAKAKAKAKAEAKAKAKGKAKAKAKGKAKAKATAKQSSDGSEEEHSSAPYNNEQEEKEVGKTKKQRKSKVKISAMKLPSTKSYGESTPRNKSISISKEKKVPEEPKVGRSKKVGNLFRINTVDTWNENIGGCPKDWRKAKSASNFGGANFCFVIRGIMSSLLSEEDKVKKRNRGKNEAESLLAWSYEDFNSRDNL